MYLEPHSMIAQPPSPSIPTLRSILRATSSATNILVFPCRPASLLIFRHRAEVRVYSEADESPAKDDALSRADRPGAAGGEEYSAVLGSLHPSFLADL